MTTTIWGQNNLNGISVSADAGDQFDPAVADSGGGAFGVAWASEAGVTVRFFDVIGEPDPALGQFTLNNNSFGTSYGQASMAAGGAGVGYGVTWQEISGSNSAINLRYIGLSAPIGGVINVATGNADLVVHHVATSGYTDVDATFKPLGNIDGLNVAWIATDTSAATTLTAAQINAGLGTVMLQRYAVPLNNAGDPLSPPVAAGLDGAAGGASDAPVTLAAIGRNVVTASEEHLSGDTIVAWIDENNAVHANLFTANGTPITTASGAVAGGVNLDNLGTAAATGKVEVISDGASFILAWATANGVSARVFTAGANPNTFAAGNAIQLFNAATLPAGENFTGEFFLGGLIDTGGFVLTVGAVDGAGNKDVYAQSYNGGGGSDGVLDRVNDIVVGNQDQAGAAALAGDRVITVFRDTSGGDANISAHILDSRTSGQVIIGTDTARRTIPDVLVGTIGNDIIRGLGDNDLLYGALGDDVLVGGPGSDILDGGGNGPEVGDTAVFSGPRNAYHFDYLGANMFTVTDTRAGSPDGIDTIKNVEFFRFDGEAGVNVLASDFIPAGPGVTPAAWGLTDEDNDQVPDPEGTPDVDGFIVNNTAGVRPGLQANPFVADSVGEFVGVVWETPGSDGNLHIRGQFYDVVLEPDTFIPNPIDISDGVGIETNPVLTSGGANSGWGAAWEQRNNASDDTRTIRTNFVGPTTLTGPELTVLDEGDNVDQHDAALFGSFLDRTKASPVGGSVLPTGMNDGYNVVWVSTDTGAIDANYGRIMMQRFEVPLDALGNPGAPARGGVDGIAGLGSDAAFQLADSGRNPSTTALHTFETAIVWIEKDGTGGERVVGRVYDDLGQVVNVPGFNNISAGFPVAAGTNAHVVSAGAVNFGIAWVTGTAEAGYKIMGTMFASPGTGLNGEGFGLAAPAAGAPYVLQELPFGVDISNLEFNLSNLSGEDSEDMVVTWKQNNGGEGADVMARHIRVTLDPVTGQLLSMLPEGNAIKVNATTEGTQDQSSIAGLLGDRFISVYRDDNNSYTDGGDIIARVIDTRAPGQDIEGDFVRLGIPQARRDVLVGTVGDDTIRGDIQDFDGRTDDIWGALGDDVIMGGPGLKGAAAIPEQIFGGEGDDISVYTGRPQDYSITVNGDGSYEIIDLRPVDDDDGNDLMHDGVDNIFDIETLRFLNLTQAGGSVPADWASANPSFTDIKVGAPGTPPPPQAGFNGTPVNWSLTDTSQFKGISVNASAGTQSGVAVTNLQTGAAITWISGNNKQVWAISHDTTGVPDPVLLDAATQLTDGGAGGVFTDNDVTDIDAGMTAGLGLTAVWESTDVTGDDSADTSIHLRTASTNTNTVLGGAGVPGPGVTGTEDVMVGSDGAGIAVDPTIQGYEIVDSLNDTLEFGFHASYVMKANAGDAYGDLMLARYEIPVYDLQLNGGGLPVVDANGNGVLARDGAGNLRPSSDLNTGAETAPISIGLDGLRGTADDSQAIVLTNAGLFSTADPAVTGSPDADHTPIKGRDVSIGTLHDGQLVVTYIDQNENIRLRIFEAHVNQDADRETGGLGGVDVQARGHTTYSELSLPFSTTIGHVLNAGQTQFIVPQLNGSFGVFWADTGASGTMAVKGVIYNGAGANWIPSPVLTLQNNLDPATLFQISTTGVTSGGLEDGYFLSWENGGDIKGQRFDMAGNRIGATIMVDDSANVPAENHSLHSAAGLDDGRILVSYQNAAGDIDASYLDTRQPGVPIIGPRTGAPQDVLVGTVGDDSIDGRGANDELYGGLGNDLLTLGTGADIGDGGIGNDTIIGGSGQDILIGGGGNDLLVSGANGPADPQIDRALAAGLTATRAQANANGGVSDTGLTTAQLTNFINNNPGADMVSGGDGNDTISLQGEFGDFRINLATAIVESDRDSNGSFILEDVIGNVVADGAGGQIFQFSANVENATGGFGDDTMIGNGADNIIDVGGGNNTVDGAGGAADRVVIHANRADLLISFNNVTQTFTIVKPAEGTSPEMTQIVKNVEFFTFDDIGTVTAAALLPGPAASDDNATVAEDLSVTIDVLTNDANSSGANIRKINDIAIQNGGPAIALPHGSVVMTNSGTGSDHLIYKPVPNYFGPDSFTYTIQNTAGQFSTATVNVTVTNVNDLPTDINFAGTAVNENAAAGTVVSTLTTLDPDNTTVGTNDTFTYTLADNFGGAFQIVGNQIQVLNGGLLDFESGVISYALNVAVDDGHGGTFAEAVTIAVNNVNEAPTDIIFNGNAATTAVSVAEYPVSNLIATLTATDSDAPPNGTAGVSFGLADSADGRFSIVNGQISVVNTALIDWEDTTRLSHSFTLQTTAKDAGGMTRTEPLTVNVTDSVETLRTGTTGDNTLTGTAGNDILNGLAGKDTMNGAAGNDTYYVDNSGDKMTENANAGNDTVYVQTLTSFGLGSNFENLIYLGSANGTRWSGNAAANALVGGGGSDTLTGAAGNDHLIGNAGADTLQGDDGVDRLYGSAGNDTLNGGNGNDWLEGGAGNDSLTGAANNDTYFLSGIFGTDTISGFGDVAGNQDLIAFSSSVVPNFATLQTNVVQSGANVQINLVGVGSVIVTGVQLNTLGADDFLFL